MPPVFIEKAQDLWCFRGVRIENLGITYEHSRKAWMNGAIFIKFLKRRSARVRGRRVVLLVDNASSHHTGLDGEELVNGFQQCRFSQSLLVLFIHPNLTSEVQPMDSGVIATFKAHYKSTFIKWVLNELENDRPHLLMNFCKLQTSLQELGGVQAPP